MTTGSRLKNTTHKDHPVIQFEREKTGWVAVIRYRYQYFYESDKTLLGAADKLNRTLYELNPREVGPVGLELMRMAMDEIMVGLRHPEEEDEPQSE